MTLKASYEPDNEKGTTTQGAETAPKMENITTLLLWDLIKQTGKMLGEKDEEISINMKFGDWGFQLTRTSGNDGNVAQQNEKKSNPKSTSSPPPVEDKQMEGRGVQEEGSRTGPISGDNQEKKEELGGDGNVGHIGCSQSKGSSSPEDGNNDGTSTPFPPPMSKFPPGHDAEGDSIGSAAYLSSTGFRPVGWRVTLEKDDPENLNICEIEFKNHRRLKPGEEAFFHSATDMEIHRVFHRKTWDRVSAEGGRCVLKVHLGAGVPPGNRVWPKAPRKSVPPMCEPCDTTPVPPAPPAPAGAPPRTIAGLLTTPAYHDPIQHQCGGFAGASFASSPTEPLSARIRGSLSYTNPDITIAADTTSPSCFAAIPQKGSVYYEKPEPYTPSNNPKECTFFTQVSEGPVYKPQQQSQTGEGAVPELKSYNCPSLADNWKFTAGEKDDNWEVSDSEVSGLVFCEEIRTNVGLEDEEAVYLGAGDAVYVTTQKEEVLRQYTNDCKLLPEQLQQALTGTKSTEDGKEEENDSVTDCPGNDNQGPSSDKGTKETI